MGGGGVLKESEFMMIIPGIGTSDFRAYAQLVSLSLSLSFFSFGLWEKAKPPPGLQCPARVGHDWSAPLMVSNMLGPT